MNPYLLDTQIVSYIYNKHPFADLYSEFLVPKNLLFVALQSKAEVILGSKHRNWGPQRANDLLMSLNHDYRVVLPTDETGAIWADLMSISRKQGREFSVQDAWVAATAVSFELPLITHDNDFLEYPGLKIIRKGGK